MEKRFSDLAFEDFLHWEKEDKKIFKRIIMLIKDCERNGYGGIGKPEPLKHNWRGYWSKRITDEHRLVFKIENDVIKIAACRYHYD